MKNTFKKIVAYILVASGVDGLFRHLNSNKLLVVMYHGVTLNAYNPPVWTQLPVDKFRRQLGFLKNHYSIVSQEQVLDALDGKIILPPNAALITFDDGYKNNFNVTFPVLQEMQIPATIFLTVDRIGSDNPLWVDEIYLLLHSKDGNENNLPFVNEIASDLYRSGRTWDAYCVTVETLKLSGEYARESYLQKLRQVAGSDDVSRYEDFCLLGWDEVFSMRDSGLVSFGVHTATHRILTDLAREEWEQEIHAPRIKLEKLLGTHVRTFCFPNGRPGIDFNNDHILYMKNCGYSCSFTTESGLFSFKGNDCMQIGRIPAGNNISSNIFFFRLNCSGFISFIQNIVLAHKSTNAGIGKL